MQKQMNESFKAKPDIETNAVPCPFVYGKGKRCAGHVVGIKAFKAFKADIEWTRESDGSWNFSVGEPRSHYHVACSLKDNHAGFGRPDSVQMKFYSSDLPAELLSVIGCR